MIQAFEVMGNVDENGQLLLDQPLEIPANHRVKIIILMTDDRDPDDTPTEEIKASLKQALQEAKKRDRIPLEQMWEGIDAE